MAISRLAWSYVLDWIIIIAAIVIALLLSTVHPDDHKFCVLDLSISQPHREVAKVSLPLFIFLTIVAPVLFIVSVSLFCSPPVKRVSAAIASRRRSLGRLSSAWQRKLWELHAGLLGFSVSVATATVIFTAVKNLTGKPRPDFLERCQPDLNRIEEYKVGGFGQRLSPLWVMVTMEICQQPDKFWLNDGLRSFPSGYATISFASLWYLTLWLCAKFDIVVPSSTTLNNDHQPPGTEDNGECSVDLLGASEDTANNSTNHQPPSPSSQHSERQRNRRTPTAPPAFLLPLPYFTFGLAVFLSGTRYFDFRNHGFDVLAGAAVGSLTAWLRFRWYHPALSLGSTAWRPRSDDQAFFPRSVAL